MQVAGSVVVSDPQPRGDEAVESVAELERRAKRGTIALGVRTVLAQGIVFVGQIILARTLEPGDFGVFAVAAFAMTALQIFGEAGIAPALVQRKGEPSSKELASVLGFQLLAGIGVVAIAFAGADVLRLWRDVPPSAPWLLRALSIAFVFQSLRVIPVIRLQRRLLFTRVAVSDVVQPIAFYGVAIPLAIAGERSWSLAIATVAQAFAGAATAYALAPYVPRLGLDRATLKPLLKYGIAYQTKHVFGLINNAVTPLFAGMMLGPRALGLVGWAQATAGVPVRFVDLVVQVTFPLISRLKDRPADAARAFERAVQLAGTGAFLFTALYLGLGPAIVDVIYTGQWLPALTPLYIYTVAYTCAFFNPVAAAAIDALGKPATFARLTIVGAIANWVGVVIGTLLYGLDGFVVGHALGTMVVPVLALGLVRRMLPEIRLWRRVRGPIAATVVAAAVGRFALLPYAGAGWSLALSALGVIAIFAGVLAVLDPGALRALRDLRKREPADATSEAPVIAEAAVAESAAKPGSVT